MIIFITAAFPILTPTIKLGRASLEKGLSFLEYSGRKFWPEPTQRHKRYNMGEK